MNEIGKYPGQLVFGLDIGTRSIVGTVGYKEKDIFHVVAQRVKEHETRAMLDGQIHDIEKVGETISEVKQELEAVVGRTLTDVCIAAAGRVLRTVAVHVEQDYGVEREISKEDIYELDSMGVEKAYDEFLQVNDTEMKFYCVGYSVVRYFMNGYPMGNLENHKAKNVAVDIIATFLPDDVVNGLYKAVELSGLNVANMTLEPIAAIQVAIPDMYRMLNIALVDVGAGTSDISITKEGSIVAYGMIPAAGDCLTDLIAQHCLVDFVTAEQIKRQACNTEKIEYNDIMGLPQNITDQEIVKVLEPVLADMTKQISDKIKELNGDKPVSAVFVVGGGGKIPSFTQRLAEELGIQDTRVALRGEEVMQKIEFWEREIQKDSLLVTPVGICLTFYMHNNSFIFVNFNGKRLKLYDTARLAVIDAAMQAEFPNEGLFPKRGKELNFVVNNAPRIVRGKLGEAAIVTVNGEVADLHKPIKENDIIQVQESTAGDAASVEIQSLPEYHSSLHVVINGKNIELPKFASVNGELQSGYYEIKENDCIEMLAYYTVEQVLQFLDIILEKKKEILVNNTRADYNTKVYDNFSMDWNLSGTGASDGNLYESATVEQKEVIEEVQEAVSETNVSAKEHKPEGKNIVVLVNGKPIHMSGKNSYIFVDIFDYIDFDLSKPKGTSVAAEINGKEAQYMEPIHDGDVAAVYWRNA